MDDSKSRVSRRNFLLAVGVGGAATAAAVAAKVVPQQAEKVAAKPQAKGYSASEHVRNYYRTAKV